MKAKSLEKGKTLPHEISGNVIGEDGSPMIGVSIQVKGKAVGTVTNIDGNYRLVLPNNSDAIVVTYVGYVPQEILLKNNNWQRIVLKEDANMLDAVVVVGYGTVKKRDLTGAISTVKADEMGSHWRILYWSCLGRKSSRFICSPKQCSARRRS